MTPYQPAVGGTQRPLHVAVVGAGIIGLSVAYHLNEAGARVTIVDRDPEGDKASMGNAGAIAVTEVLPASTPDVFRRIPGWLFDPLGPLAIRPSHALRLLPWLTRFAKVGNPSEVGRIARALSLINSRAYEDWVPMLLRMGLERNLHRSGALTVYESRAAYERDAPEWACKRSLSIRVEELTGSEARSLEPALGRNVSCAVLTPEWSYVSDPKELVDRIREWLRTRGVVILKGEARRVDTTPSSTTTLKLEDGRKISADRIVIATGAWSAQLAHTLGDKVLLESERGYNTTIRNPGVMITRQLVFAERKFVATPLSCGLRIGGAAEFGGLRARPDFRRSQRLASLAKYYIPELQTNGGSYWAGHRPSTPDSLPVIGPSPRHKRIMYAFGHGHLGLTQAATTGRLVSELLLQGKSLIDVAPFRIERFG